MCECNEVAVSTAFLESQINSMREAVDTVDQNLGKLYEAIATLNQMWEGEANESFCERFENDELLIESLCIYIRKIIESMENAKKEYENCEEINQQLVDTIRM